MGGGRGESGRIGGMRMESLAGRLLVATPALKDPNFERTRRDAGSRTNRAARSASFLNRAHRSGPLPRCSTCWGGLGRGTRRSFSRAARCSPSRPICPRPARALATRPRVAGFQTGVSGAVGHAGSVAGIRRRFKDKILGVRGLRRLRRLGGWAAARTARSRAAHGSCSTRWPGDPFPSPRPERSVARWCCAGQGWALMAALLRSSRLTRR